MTTIWDNVREHIRTRMNPSSFDTWFAPTTQIDFQQNMLRIAVPDKYFVNWLEEHYMSTILDILQALTGTEVTITFVIDENLARAQVERSEEPPVPARDQAETQEQETQPRPPEYAFPQLDEDPGLNPKYTFDTYVVGGSNQFAHAASRAVAEQPSKAYNPLFIYGGVGLGKTHLMHAIGHAIYHRNMPGFRLYYLSYERFMNELINAIRYDTMQQFREKYRNIDVLLIDDIQFIAGKERTQEEFFHTFNALYDSQKQIVISSDCPPKKIPTLEERLRSRFEWGLIADIQPPDLETKIAILKKKAEIEAITLPDEVALFIATKIKSNIRALEGCLIKIAAHSTITKEQITVELAQRVLNDILETGDSSAKTHVTVELIQEIVANHYNIKLEDMKSATRLRTIAFPRQIAMYLSRKLTDLSLPTVGQYFGGKDHTTIMYACQKIETMLQEDPEFQRELQHLETTIRT
ncbi:chromosomal replication initiator protein DnaA [candidate division KSB3 bacterium]|uniref:Chromosomal replication initiator protein DnaA n=1 Tax=candidate division KSB3 bacterium TaxID=2044937 RepID=A0A9D5Q8Z4_9BACT|nr:chromosomal replication initiator protein DnaA [candidate division KSB3 bacterium]MBD3327361.1 chromosomal replication initiator protein DnaA [candidate division KSB3 bacterium]